MDVEKLGGQGSGHLFTQVTLGVFTSPGRALPRVPGASAGDRADSDPPSKVGQDAPDLGSVLLPECAAPPGGRR